MINLYLVYRQYHGSADSVIGSFLVERHAKAFMAECAKLSGATARLRMESTVLCTYGMTEETRRELFQAVNPIVRKESAGIRITKERESEPETLFGYPTAEFMAMQHKESGK